MMSTIHSISTTSQWFNVTRYYFNDSDDVTVTDNQILQESTIVPPVQVPNILMASLYWPTSAIGFIGNLAVLVAFWRERTQLFKVNFNLFLLNLTIVDMFVFIFDLPFITAWGFFHQLWPHNDVACTFILFADWTLPLVSILTTVAISVDRYGAACWSTQYRNYNTRIRTLFFVFLIWLGTAATVVPSFIVSRLTVKAVAENPAYCDAASFFNNPIFPIYVAIAGYHVPSIIMVVCYVKVYRKVVQSHRTAVIHVAPAPSVLQVEVTTRPQSLTVENLDEFSTTQSTTQSTVENVNPIITKVENEATIKIGNKIIL